MCLAAEALHRRFAGFKFFPVYFYVFYKSDVIYLCYGSSGGEGDSIYWISCQYGDIRAGYRVYSLIFNAIAYPGFGKFNEFPLRITVQVFSALTVYVWNSMFSCLHIALKSVELFMLSNMIFNLLDVYFA